MPASGQPDQSDLGDSNAFDSGRLAREFQQAEHDRMGLVLPTDRWPDFSWTDARATAQARDRIRMADGEELIGYKLGWTSAAMRDALGIDRPNWGTLWSSQVLGSTMQLDSMIHPKVEPEFVYHAKDDLRGDVSVEDVAAGCAGWSVGLEVVDPRFPSFSFQWLDNTADSSSAAGICVGPAVSLSPNAADPADLELTFSDGVESRTGPGSQAMGSPLAAVVWLIKQLATEGEYLRAGQLVFTGGITAPFDLRVDTTFTVSNGRLGQCSLTPQ